MEDIITITLLFGSLIVFVCSGLLLLVGGLIKKPRVLLASLVISGLWTFYSLFAGLIMFGGVEGVMGVIGLIFAGMNALLFASSVFAYKSVKNAQTQPAVKL